MKITVNYIRCSVPAVVVSAGLFLSGCAPIPQAYPDIPQSGLRHQTNNVPQAAPLLPRQQPANVQRYAAKPSNPPVSGTTAVPPTLQPAQQQAKTAAVTRRPVQQAQVSRPAASTTPRKQAARKVIPAVRPAEKRVPPPPKVEKKKVLKPSPVVQTKPRPQQTAVPVQKKPEPAVEVLDLGGSKIQQSTSKPVEKVAPAPVYQNNPAVIILTKQANNQLVAGKTGRAASTLERALRIDPDNAMLWLRLAEVNEQQGKKSQAASMAKKAIGLAPDDANIKQRGARLIN